MNILNEIEQLQARKQNILDIYEPLQKQLMDVTKRIIYLRNEYDSKQIANGFRDFTQEIKYYLFYDGNLTDTRYKAQSRYFRELDLSTYRDSKRTENFQQICLSIWHSSIDGASVEAITNLEKIYPYILGDVKFKIDSSWAHTIFASYKNGWWSIDEFDERFATLTALFAYLDADAEDYS